MKLILADGAGTGYYPYTQKPVDYQPYRPVYLFRGPPPDAGFSYGLFEDEDSGRQYYSSLGLDPFSPLSGKSAKLVEELSSQELERLLGDDLRRENLREVECPECSQTFFQNLEHFLKERDFWCHCCGTQLPRPKEGDDEK